MATTLDALREALDALCAAGAERDVATLTPGELMAVVDGFGMARRRLDAAFAPFAAEVARQSRPDLGRDSLARRQGHRSPVSLISTTSGASVAEVARVVQVAEATAPRLSLTGESLPATRPHVAAAVSAGRLGMTAASAIVTMLQRISLRVDPARLDAAERELAELAPGLRPDELSKLLARAEAQLDPDGLEPRYEEARAARSLILRERDGMFHLTGKLDVETAAPIKAALDGIVTGVLQRNEHAEGPERDARSVPQIQADALADLARHALGCDTVPTGPTTTVVVRMTLEDLASGFAGAGIAEIDGIDQPVPAGAVRRLAADAQIVPCVLGGESEILDWGRAKRLFTPVQKLALVERDGGCARCGAPPSHCIAHHIDWWGRDAGLTDLRNGVLLCTSCHHAVHDEGWEIRVDGVGTRAQVWFTPPSWLDPSRTPRPGVAHRYALSA